MVDMAKQRFLRRAVVKKIIRRTIGLITLVCLAYSLVALIYATRTIYKVRMNYAVVLERFDGRREAVTDVGWHMRLPFFTRIEHEVALMNQRMYLGGQMEPMRIISKGNVALWTSGVLTYRIRDLKTWAIENLDPMYLLQGDYDGIVKDLLQAEPVDQLISEREQVKEKIFQALKSRSINVGGPTLEGKYGIEIVSFVLKETRFGDKLVEATEEKKRRELIAEAENYAADQEASRIRKLYAAYVDGIASLQKSIGRVDGATDGAILEFLTQQKWATAYEKNPDGRQTVVIQNTQSSPALTLPSVPPIATPERSR